MTEHDKRGIMKVPTTADLYLDCKWGSAGDGTSATAAAAIKEMYVNGLMKVGFDEKTPKAHKLYNEAMIMATESSCHAIPPTVLFCDSNNIPLRYARDAFEDKRGVSAAKGLEQVNECWDYFRCQHDMPVVPPAMTTGGKQETSAHRFMFEHKQKPVTGTIMNKKNSVDPSFTAVDPKKYYVPFAVSHPAFESMCVTVDKSKEKQTLVLFQSKINADLLGAIRGLEAAAEALKVAKLWNGDFLFVIFALETKNAEKTMEECNYPIVFVNNSNLDEYFTPTLAPAAELHYLRHVRLNKNRPSIAEQEGPIIPRSAV
jgi:hypothetical protein